MSSFGRFSVRFVGVVGRLGLAFDRRELLGSIAAAVSSGDVLLRPGTEVELYVDCRPAGPLKLR